MRQHVLKQMAYTAAAALLLGWMWLVPAVGVWATLAAQIAPEPELQRIVLVAPAPAILQAQVAEAAERDVTDAKAQCGYHADVPRCYGPQYKRHCTDCPYEVVRETDMALAEWQRVRGEVDA